MGIAALVLGIIAFVLAITFVLAPLGVVLAVIGLILGIVDTVKKGKAGAKKTISIVGLILSAIMFIILVIESFFILVVGVAVYNSADDSLIRRAEEMESENIAMFNAKFSGYEGNQTGSRVKILLNNILINNTNSYAEHEIDVYYNGLIEASSELKQKIDASQKYTVTFLKDTDGYISKAYIEPSSNVSGYNEY